MSSLARAVTNGIDNDFIRWAEDFGKSISTDVTSSQIRNVYGTVKIMEMQRPLDLPRLLLLKPRIAYANVRNKGLEKLATELINAIDVVAEGGDEATLEQRFSNFSQGFEAILAYHKVAKENRGGQRQQQGGRR